MSQPDFSILHRRSILRTASERSAEIERRKKEPLPEQGDPGDENDSREVFDHDSFAASEFAAGLGAYRP